MQSIAAGYNGRVVRFVGRQFKHFSRYLTADILVEAEKQGLSSGSLGISAKLLLGGLSLKS